MYLPHRTTVRIRTCVKSLAQRMAGHLVDSRREDSRPLWRGTSARLLMAPYVKGSFLGQGRVPFLGQPSFNERSMWGANSAPIVPSRVISRVHVHLRSRDLRRRCRGLAFLPVLFPPPSHRRHSQTCPLSCMRVCVSGNRGCRDAEEAGVAITPRCF